MKEGNPLTKVSHTCFLNTFESFTFGSLSVGKAFAL